MALRLLAAAVLRGGWRAPAVSGRNYFGISGIFSKTFSVNAPFEQRIRNPLLSGLPNINNSY